MCMFNTKEAASYLGVSEATIHRLRKVGKLDSFKVGAKLVRFSQELHLDAFLKRQKQGPMQA